MNPFLALAGAHILLATAWRCFPPRSVYRPIIVALVVICCFVSFNSIDMNTWWGTELAEYVCGFAMYANYFLCLRKLVTSNTSSPLRNLKAQYEMLFSSRWGIPAKELPNFSAADPEYVPSRRAFLLRRCWTFAWTTSAFAILQSNPLDIWPDDFESPKNQLLRRLPDVSAREWVILFHISISTWFMPYCLFTAAHSLASVVAVAYGDAPIRWRPLFGDIREAYTVQRFFGSVHDGNSFGRHIILTVLLGSFGTSSCAKHSPNMHRCSFMMFWACHDERRNLGPPSSWSLS